MTKKNAVIVRDRQGEALRMAVGLTLADDSVDVFVLDRRIENTAANAMNLEAMDALGITLYANVEGVEGATVLSPERMAHALLECDNILPY